MRTMLRLGASLAAWLALGAAAAPPTYVVRRVGTVIADDERIGRQRAGLMCLPDRLVRWKDVPTGTGEQQREIVRGALERAGLRVTALAPSEVRRRATAMVVSGTIVAAAMLVCARSPGLLSGDLALDMEWRIETADGTIVPTYTSSIRQRIAPQAGRPIGVLYTLLLRAAAEDLARHLAPPPN